MEPTPNKPPVEMTIHRMFQRLTAIMEAATPEQREEFKKCWLNSVHWFDAENEWLRQERLRNSR